MGTDEFNGQLTNKVINTDSNKKIISDIVDKRNKVHGQSTSTVSQKVSTQGMSAKKTNKFLPSIEELVAAAAAGPAVNAINLLSNKASKSNKTENGGGAVIMSIPTKNGAVMLPIPVNVNAYKKYRDGGQVTIDELFGY